MSNLPTSRDSSALPLHSTLVCRPAQREETHAALRLILATAAQPASEEQVVDFLRFAVYRGIQLSDLWVAEDHGRLVWAVLPVRSPGRTMLLFAPMHVPHDLKDTCARPMVEQIAAHFARDGVQLAQVLLDPVERAARDLFNACGFETLAELIYMHRDIRRAHDSLLPAGFVWRIYSQASHAQFVRALAQTYEGSLDCPGLNGRRDIEDVLAGHKAAGEFDPNLWMMLCEGDQPEGEKAQGDSWQGDSPQVDSPRGDSPRGVVLLNRSPHSDAMEVVYLGLLPSARGRGLGDVLMRRTLALAFMAGSRQLSLAVDSRNAPALKLYRRHGLKRICTRLAMLRDLRNLRDPSYVAVSPANERNQQAG